MHVKQVVFDGEGGTVEVREYRENAAGKMEEVTLGHVVFTRRLMGGRRRWELYRAGSDAKVADADIPAESTFSLTDLAMQVWRSVASWRAP